MPKVGDKHFAYTEAGKKAAKKYAAKRSGFKMKGMGFGDGTGRTKPGAPQNEDWKDEQSKEAAKKRGDIVDLTRKPVGPRAEKKKAKKETPGDVDLSPGYEDPIKIQKLQREGKTPGSQKFLKKTQEQKEDEAGVGTNIKIPKVMKDGSKNKAIYKGKVVKDWQPSQFKK